MTGCVTWFCCCSVGGTAHINSLPGPSGGEVGCWPTCSTQSFLQTGLVDIDADECKPHIICCCTSWWMLALLCMHDLGRFSLHSNEMFTWAYGEQSTHQMGVWKDKEGFKARSMWKLHTVTVSYPGCVGDQVTALLRELKASHCHKTNRIVIV